MALVGTGHRGTGMWGSELLANCGSWVELVGLCDANPLRLEAARALIGTDAPLFTDLSAMLAAVRPETVIVCSRDVVHDEHVVTALEAGCDVVSEKPLTISAAKTRRILEAERRTGRRVDVTFNYRYSPTNQKIRELLAEGAIGEVVSADFHWYLDTQHGADYFRRWHAYMSEAGSLFVHKATHHFDLLSWHLAAEPREVFARGSLRNYGRANAFRGPRCARCEHASHCDYHVDINRDRRLAQLYEGPSAVDGYVRDACVFREDIDIWDTMTADIAFANGVQVAYSLNCFMPIEGHHLAYNGRGGRIEIRQFERQPWDTPDHDEILLVRNFKGAERIIVPHQPGGHFGGDPVLQRMLFKPGTPDPLGQRAGSRAGAVSVLCGVAAVESVRQGRPVTLAELDGLPDSDAARRVA